MCLFCLWAKFQTAMVLCMKFIWITNSSYHRKVWEEICSSNPPVVTGIWDPNKSQAWQNHFFVYKQNLWLDNLKTKTAMKVKISVFIICVKAIMYLILHNLHDCYIPLNDVYWNDKIEISR